MLPAFRLGSAGSEEDLTSADPDSTVGGSLEDSASPTNCKPFRITDKLVEYPC